MGLPETKDTSQKYTYKDYLCWPDEERWEIIYGTAYNNSPAPATEHQRILRQLITVFNNYLKDKSCEVFPAPFDVRMPENDEDDDFIETVVQPDIVVVCDKKKLDKKGLRGVPDLIIEIISPATAGLDMKEKFYLYEHKGVKEYWIVFPDEQTVMVFKLKDNGYYGKPDTYVSTDTIKVGIFDDFAVDLSGIFSGVG